MAAALDINILCNKMLDFIKGEALLSKHNVSLESMNSIDNWMWENEKEIEDSKQIANILNMQHIVVIKLSHQSIRDMGIYIEKIDNKFLYTLWINTEGYTILDCEKITVDNSEFYQKIVLSILEMNQLIEDAFEVVGIGLETDFCCEKNVMDIIQKSKNMMIWILNKHNELNIQFEKFKIDMVEGVYVLRRR